MIKIETLNTVAIIRISGDLGYDTVVFRDYLEIYTNNIAYKTIVVDFRTNCSMCSSVIGVLLSHLNGAKDNISVVVIKDSCVDKTIKLTKLNNVLKVFYSLNECLQSLTDE